MAKEKKEKLVKNPIKYDKSTRYEYTLAEKESSEPGPFIHTAPKKARASIEAHGLRPSKPGWDEHKGVYAVPHPGVDTEILPDYATHLSQYGDDIYHINQPKNTKVYYDGEDGYSANFFTRTIKHSDFKRTGHIFHNDDGHAQVHWHKEEECPEGKSPKPKWKHEDDFPPRHSDGLMS